MPPSRITPGWRTTSSTATTSRRWPIARSRPRDATRRLRRRRRTRCTCRRTRSRASATGRTRSTPTANPARSRSASALSLKSCTRWTTASTPTCRPGRIGARDNCSSLSPRSRSRFDPDAIGSAAPGSAGVFALAAIPARYALERGDWADAAKLETHPGKYPYTEALTHFARALGAARTGDVATVRSVDRGIAADPAAAHDGEGTLLGRTGRDSAPRRDGVARVCGTSQRRSSHGNAGGRDTGGRHGKGGGDARTVGTRARTARRDALAAGSRRRRRRSSRQRSRSEPNRFRAVNGAARGASLAGDRIASRRYYAQLLKICTRADSPGRPELAEARRASQAASKRAS